MKAFWKGFASYAVIGLANMLIHWQVFFVLTTAAELNQALGNFLAFCVAASFSFYVNALYTFDARVSVLRYLLFVGLMGAMSFGIGFAADSWGIRRLVTVATYSLLSLLLGFLFSRLFMVREPEA
ncbi:GtrA family protein [Pseudomonas sp. MYb118]|uniref:GtrA family protein n=1 Tax=Pseudomonas sp. MYb118 TaxID=1848720 RepID=UPI0034CD452B